MEKSSGCSQIPERAGEFARRLEDDCRALSLTTSWHALPSSPTFVDDASAERPQRCVGVESLGRFTCCPWLRIPGEFAPQVLTDHREIRILDPIRLTTKHTDNANAAHRFTVACLLADGSGWFPPGGGSGS